MYLIVYCVVYSFHLFYLCLLTFFFFYWLRLSPYYRFSCPCINPERLTCYLLIDYISIFQTGSSFLPSGSSTLVVFWVNSRLPWFPQEGRAIWLHKPHSSPQNICIKLPFNQKSDALLQKKQKNNNKSTGGGKSLRSCINCLLVSEWMQHFISLPCHSTHFTAFKPNECNAMSSSFSSALPSRPEFNYYCILSPLMHEI